MNYLAHVTIAADDDDARLGALLGDFAKGLEIDRLPPAVRQGLDEHRNVDRWFDAHDEVREARGWFPGRMRRFAGILIDVFVDHVLVRDWEQLRPTHVGDKSVKDVSASLYRAIGRHGDLLPPRLERVAPSMILHDWLASYGDVQNVERALVGIGRRLRRDVDLRAGLDVLEARRGEFRALTGSVFPEIVGRAVTERSVTRSTPAPGSSPRSR